VAREGDLLTVTVLPEAEARLGIRTVDVETRPFARRRALGGTAEVPPGLAVEVTAPLAGTLRGEAPVAGRPVTAGQPVFTLAPFLTADSRAALSVSRAEAEGALAAATVERAAAQVELDRAERLLGEGSGSRKAVDQARARRDAAVAGAKAARGRSEVLAAALAGDLEALPVASPIAGVLRRIAAAPGQKVTAGAALFEVASLARLWIRVPVYVGELASLDAAKPAKIDGVDGTPAAAPPSADAAKATADLVYEVDNAGGTFRPGQIVAVEIPMRSEGDSLAVPSSALVTDVNGGTWVYERVGAGKFVRRRVAVRHVEGGTAALAEGPAAGAKVVVSGVMELFGVEFGHAK
jgi:RND family efflux transporter MFP subunit